MNKLTQSQINTASWEIRDFNTVVGVSIEEFADYFYDVAKALGYDSTLFVELMEREFKEECSEVITRIKVSEGW